MRTTNTRHLGQSVGLALVLALMSVGIILVMIFASGIS